MNVTIPELLKHRALQKGEAGRAWLETLPQTFTAIERALDIRFVAQLAGGTEALVFACDSPNGSVVAKLGLPNSLGREVQVLKLAAGQGYAKLQAYDSNCDVMVIESLGDQLANANMSAEEQMEVLCATLKVAWQFDVTEEGLVSGKEKAEAQTNFIRQEWGRLDRPCSIQIVDRALEYAAIRAEAYDPANCCLVHGDAHIWNALEAQDSSTGYKFVDPDGLFAEPAVDLAISLREWRQELLDGDTLQLGWQRCERLSHLAGVDGEAIWQWGYVEHVACGLLDLNLMAHREAEEHFAIAQRWLAL